MAVTRTKLFDTIANGAAWDAGVVFNRTNGIPIDKFSVFTSYDEARTYASSNPVAYPGQVIAVVPEDGETIGYIIQTDGTLKILAIADNINELSAEIERIASAVNELKSKLFVGTKTEYEAAEAKNEIAIGAIVIITDDEETLAVTTTSVLGQAVLGQMILG